mmetsp:Transcript_41539/g.47921  ORF Transcript_41539/g.47921 Transcript_41539/m.47921 type:complete len:84 (+) Transcript_41539:133-384(+)
MSTLNTVVEKKETVVRKLNTEKKEEKHENAFINLTNRETCNNLIGTYSAITIILRNIYEKYYGDPYYAEMVDNLSSQIYSYPS